LRIGWACCGHAGAARQVRLGDLSSQRVTLAQPSLQENNLFVKHLIFMKKIQRAKLFSTRSDKKSPLLKSASPHLSSDQQVPVES
jgi:hypothetical protein